jgi:hypothetical protein
MTTRNYHPVIKFSSPAPLFANSADGPRHIGVSNDEPDRSPGRELIPCALGSLHRRSIDLHMVNEHGTR